MSEHTFKLTDVRSRDACILPDATTQTYYLCDSLRADKDHPYGGAEVYTSRNLVDWQGPFPVFVVSEDFWAHEGIWAPELHAYRGKYYLFLTLKHTRPFVGSPSPQLAPSGQARLAGAGGRLPLGAVPTLPQSRSPARRHDDARWDAVGRGRRPLHGLLPRVGADRGWYGRDDSAFGRPLRCRRQANRACSTAAMRPGEPARAPIRDPTSPMAHIFTAHEPAGY